MGALDVAYISRQVGYALDVVDWGTVDSLYISGSFANDQKEIDREGRSDVDVEMVVSDWSAFHDAQGAVVCYDGLHPATIHIRGEEDHGFRVMDLIQLGTVDPTIDRIPLDVSVAAESGI